MQKWPWSLALVALWMLPTRSLTATASSVFSHFVTVSNDRLMDGPNQLRFISVNIPNLHCIEDYMAFEETNVWRLPDAFEIRDALESVKAMGGQVVRMYTITVRRRDDTADIPRYVLGPGQFNEQAFRSLDQVLAIANEVGIRIIIPFVDNWSWMGGRAEYAGFRDKKSDDFWSDSQIKEDFKKTIHYMLHRKNTLTGTPYREDKAILAWETGNELSSPHDWVLEMAAYIKSLDQNHLLLDGVSGQGLRDETLANPYTDIVTTHHYERDPRDMIRIIRSSAEKAKGKKPYLIGEFGFLGRTGVEAILDEVTADPGICGALIWSLRFHSRDGGFYWHSEPGAGGYFYKAYHWPGFYSGENYAEREVMQLLAERGFAISGQSVPPLTVPRAPLLLACDDPGRLTWQGAAGASSYDLERARAKDGPWIKIADHISDAETAHRPLYCDDRVDIGANYYYRVLARNRAGLSKPSNVIGPLLVQHKTLVDECKNFAVAFSRSGDLTMQTDHARAFKEDAHRLAGRPGAELLYYTKGAPQAFKLYCFAKTMDQTIRVSLSADGQSFTPITLEAKDFYFGAADYEYLRPILFQGSAVPEKIHYVKITFLQEAQLARAEWIYGK